MSRVPSLSFVLLVAASLAAVPALAEISYRDCTNARGGRLPSTVHRPSIYVVAGDAASLERDPARYRQGAATAILPAHLETAHAVCVELAGIMQAADAQKALFVTSGFNSTTTTRYLFPEPSVMPTQTRVAACAPVTSAASKQRVYIRNARGDTVFCAMF